jgi:hypothetical protein
MADSNLFDPSRLYEALRQQGLLPKVTGFTPPGKASGLFNSSINRIAAAVPTKTKIMPEYDTNILAHEMTHAVQNNLLRDTAGRIQKKIEQGEKVSDQERQFLRASEQIFASSFANVGYYDSSKHRKDIEDYNKQVRSQYTGTNKDFGSYRTSPDEAQAFGVGNMTTNLSAMGNQVNPHLDPSMTTEFDILLSLYQKLPESLRTSSAQAQQQQIQQNRQTSKDVYLPMANDLFADPFKYSIK